MRTHTYIHTYIYTQKKLQTLDSDTSMSHSRASGSNSDIPFPRVSGKMFDMSETDTERLITERKGVAKQVSKDWSNAYYR